jgi:hypothetical protein
MSLVRAAMDDIERLISNNVHRDIANLVMKDGRNKRALERIEKRKASIRAR